jgi:ATP phosphoribosyltransferase regulatory subunit
MKKQLPAGVQDYLQDEYYYKKCTEQRLSDYFSLWGYEQIEPPTLEYFDTFYRGGSFDTRKVFKLTDYDGSLMVLRPDPTLQIARIAATKLSAQLPSKLYYIVNSYEYAAGGTTPRSREFAQAGVEFLGAADAAADAEIIILAIRTLKELKLKDFQIEIGNIGFFKALARGLNLNDTDTESLRLLVAGKDVIGIKLFLTAQGAAPSTVERFITFISMFGGSEVLKAAYGICADGQGVDELKRLERVLGIIDACGLLEYVSVDLGMVQGLGYYSGIVFRGISASLGTPILNGGRYDKLCSDFGAEIPAVGFCIGTKRLMVALERQSPPAAMKPCDCAYIVLDAASEAFSYERAACLRKARKRVIRQYFKQPKELIEYCIAKNIKQAIVYADNAELVYDTRNPG